MSNAFAIAAVTATLRSLLEHSLHDRGVSAEVTTKSPDKARTTTSDQLNIFLYQTSFNAALRNSPMPHRVKPGETGEPPLALNLYYLITAYGLDDNEAFAHQLLGQAMGTLHDHPLLDPGEILDATHTPLPESDLHMQAERVRITPQPLPLEEMSKLWMTFQTQFRISAAYQVSVVLIESTRPAKTPLPALGRGSQSDSGIIDQPNLVSPFPTLLSLELPRQFSAHLLDTLTIRGFNLDGNATVRLSHAGLDLERVLTTLGTHTATEITVEIPDEPASYPAGFYTLALDVIRPGETFSRTTNRLAFSLAPETTSLPQTVTRGPLGKAELTLSCRPDVHPGQRAALLLGDREIPAAPHTAQTDTLVFRFGNPTREQAPDAVEYFARLRVDGVDSLLVNQEGAVPVFRNDQKVTIL